MYNDDEYPSTSTYLSLSNRSLENTSLILNIPPGRQNLNAPLFASKIKSLIDRAMLMGLEQVIFISTTSVYGACIGTVNNSSSYAPITASAKAHVDIENYITDKYKESSAVLKLSGLVGPHINGDLRHPALSLCKKLNIPKGRDPVNLIHQTDVISAIISILNGKCSARSLVLSSLEQPSRVEYYTWCANQLKLPSPDFIDDSEARILSKKIDARESFDLLGFTPQYPSPYDMLI